jgi:excisionase family DNA binding protein
MNERITVEDAAKMLGVSPPLVRYWIKRGMLPGMYLKREGCRVGRYLIYKEAIERWKRGES